MSDSQLAFSEYTYFWVDVGLKLTALYQPSSVKQLGYHGNWLVRHTKSQNNKQMPLMEFISLLRKTTLTWRYLKTEFPTDIVAKICK